MLMQSQKDIGNYSLSSQEEGTAAQPLNGITEPVLMTQSES